MISSTLRSMSNYLLLCAWLTTAAHAALPPEESKEHDGKPAAAFKLQTTDGKTVTLEQLKGKTVLVSFFASWCPPCRTETAELKKLLAKHGPGLAVVGVAVDRIQHEDTRPEDEKKDVAEFVTELKPGYPVGIAPAGMARAYTFKGIPTTVVVGPEGKIARTFLGFHPAAKFEPVLESLKARPEGSGR